MDKVKPLSNNQVNQYYSDGYLLASGLIPAEIAEKADDAMWNCVDSNPANPPACWGNFNGGICLYNDADLKNCYTDQYLTAAAQLTGDAPSTFSKSDTHPKICYAPDYLAAEEAGQDLSRFFRWDCAYAINHFPHLDEWRWPTLSSGAHLDHSTEEQHHKTLPPVFRIGSLVFLHNVERRGGGTVVWPGSHHKLEALARRNPGRYEYRCVLNADLAKMDLADPVELTPRQGDVLFLHNLCVHAQSMNVNNRPRFALNMKH